VYEGRQEYQRNQGGGLKVIKKATMFLLIIQHYDSEKHDTVGGVCCAVYAVRVEQITNVYNILAADHLGNLVQLPK